MNRPYQFTGEWKQIPESEWLDTHHANYYGRGWTEIWECRVSDSFGNIGCGVLAYHPEYGWEASVLSDEAEARYYWSDSYRHRRQPGEKWDRAKAQDLCEAALIGVSLFGLYNIGNSTNCP